MRPFSTKLKMPAGGVTLADEAESDKGVRMLRVVRQFVRSKNGVMAIDVDGQRIFLVKYDKDRDKRPGHPEALTTPDAEL